MDKYTPSILLAVVILYLVAWTKTFEDELSYNAEIDGRKTPWSVSMQLMGNVLQSIFLLVIGVLVLMLLNIIHFRWILHTRKYIKKAQLDEVFKSISMVLKQSFFLLLAPFIVSTIVTNVIDLGMTTFMGVGMAPITVLVCNLIFTMISFIF
jgi:hypothetical protein